MSQTIHVVTVQDALAELLDALGMKELARQAKTERDPALLREWAWMCIEKSPRKFQREIMTAAMRLDLLL